MSYWSDSFRSFWPETFELFGAVNRKREEMEEKTEGRKDDTGKLRWDLVPFRATEGMVRVLTFGAKKYAPWNWVNVPQPQARYFAATMRHLVAWWRGEKTDPESGEPHLAHAMCCIAFLLELEEKASVTTDVTIGSSAVANAATFNVQPTGDVK